MNDVCLGLRCVEGVGRRLLESLRSLRSLSPDAWTPAVALVTGWVG
jgi:hypothetical protein